MASLLSQERRLGTSQELTEVLKQVNKYSNGVFQCKLSEQYRILPNCLPLDVAVLTAQSPRFSLAGLGPGPFSEKKKKANLEKKSAIEASRTTNWGGEECCRRSDGSELLSSGN